jgi:hypothetical protein
MGEVTIMPMCQSHPLIYLSVILVALGMAVAGCTLSRTQAPRLRIKNQSSSTVKNLTVLFPEDRVEFGDIPAGVTTEYREVPHGVYHYSAYSLEINGQMITQPVTDWVGEKPIEGDDFTYTIDMDPSRGARAVVRLIKVTKD